jgi:hypothetical protein
MAGENVVSLESHVRRNKNWTRAEHTLLVRALSILAARGEEHYPEYFEDDKGNPIVALTVGYHVDATYSISKVDGRYVVLRYDGKCVADSKSLLGALSRTLFGGVRNLKSAFMYALEILSTIDMEDEWDSIEGRSRRTGGTSSR